MNKYLFLLTVMLVQAQVTLASSERPSITVDKINGILLSIDGPEGKECIRYVSRKLFIYTQKPQGAFIGIKNEGNKLLLLEKFEELVDPETYKEIRTLARKY